MLLDGAYRQGVGVPVTNGETLVLDPPSHIKSLHRTKKVSVRQIYLQNYFTLFGIAILTYDHIITFGEEYKLIWRVKFKKASLVFFLNRYLGVIYAIMTTTINFFEFSTAERCRHWSLYRQLAIGIMQTVVAVVQFLRTFALYGRSVRIGSVIIVVGLTMIVLSIWSIVGQTSEVLVLHGCHTALSQPTAIRVAVPWESLFAYDLLIFSLTLYKALKERRGISRHSLLHVMFRDGSIYFAVMASAQFANALTFYLLSPVLSGLLSTFASSISVTMMSRLMLNLHRSASHDLPTAEDISTAVVFEVQSNSHATECSDAQPSVGPSSPGVAAVAQQFTV